jgi:hypothetical protein
MVSRALIDASACRNKAREAGEPEPGLPGPPAVIPEPIQEKMAWTFRWLRSFHLPLAYDDVRAFALRVVVGTSVDGVFKASREWAVK